MSKKIRKHFINLTNRFLTATSTKEKYRIKSTDFTRDRKLSFSELSLCMLRLLRQNLQIELTKFICDVKKSIASYSSSAFIQSRKKINPDLFYDLNKLISEDFYQDNDEVVELYKGHRLLGIDGSTINLPVNADTIEMYGAYNNQKQTNDVVLARVSILYDVLNDIVLDGVLCNFKIGEVTLSQQHLPLAKENDIIIMDRAYPSFESMYEMQQRKIHFIYRCKVRFSNVVAQFYESGKKDSIIDFKPSQKKSFEGLLYHKNTVIQVRILRIELQSGESELLITSLLDTKMYPHKDFRALYYKRWAIETFYNRFKNIIGVENFSGTSNQFIQQEFNCALYMSTLQSIFSKEAQEDANEKYKTRQYEYKINTSLSLCFIRNKILEIFSDNKEIDVKLEELKTLFILNVVPIRPNRSFERNPDKYRQRTKPKQFPNRRNVI